MRTYFNEQDGADDVKNPDKMSKRELRLEVLDLRDSRRSLRRALMAIIKQKSFLLSEAQATAKRAIDHDDNL